MMADKKQQRLRRARQTRARIAQQGVVRLAVHRSNAHIYASVISGDGAKVLALSVGDAHVKAVRDEKGGLAIPLGGA